MKILLIFGSVALFVLLVIIGNRFARKLFEKDTGKPPDEMYPLY